MKPVILAILDGYGIGKDYKGNSLKFAKTPTLGMLKKEWPNAILKTSGEAVGLPEGQMGNSEVGHLNIGAGRVIFQDLTRITAAIKNKEFFKNVVLLNTMENVKKNKSNLHIMGLVSKGGVHSHMSHLIALVEMAKEQGIENVYIDAILDGRDVAPDSGMADIEELEKELERIGLGKISSISGRYYAMDRDKRWDRTKLYYDDVVGISGEGYSSSKELIKANYDREIYDEFVIPGYIEENGKRIASIEDKDSIIFFNFRPDRARQIVRAFTDEEFKGFNRDLLDIYMTTMTDYDRTIPNTHVAFEDVRPSNTLGEILAKNDKKQLRIAETEKYAHVTFFFNGGREKPYPGEDRVLIQSPHVATYDLKPEMSAIELTDELVERMKSNKYDCIILNFANPDMVGHTGNMEATIKAVETVDACLARILKQLDELGGAAIITADHGNCEIMLTDDGDIVTSHTTNPVPIYLYGVKNVKIKDGALCDISPTILELLNIEQPKEMTGKSLLIKE